MTFSAQFPPQDVAGVARLSESPGVVNSPSPHTHAEWGSTFRRELTQRGYSLPQKGHRKGVDVETQSGVFDDSDEMVPVKTRSKRHGGVQRSRTLPENMAGFTANSPTNGISSDMARSLRIKTDERRDSFRVPPHHLGPVPEVPQDGELTISHRVPHESADFSDETGVIYEDIYDSSCYGNETFSFPDDLYMNKANEGLAHFRQNQSKQHHNSNLKNKVFKKYKEKVGQQGQSGQPGQLSQPGQLGQQRQPGQQGQDQQPHPDCSSPTPFCMPTQYGLSKSRDNGVNCIGLPTSFSPCGILPPSEYGNSHTGSYDYDPSYLQPKSEKRPQSSHDKPPHSRHTAPFQNGHPRNELCGNDSGFYSPRTPGGGGGPPVDHMRDSYVPFTGEAVHQDCLYLPYRQPPAQNPMWFNSEYPGFHSQGTPQGYNDLSKGRSQLGNNSSTNSSRQTLATAIFCPPKPPIQCDVNHKPIRDSGLPAQSETPLHRDEDASRRKQKRSTKKHKHPSHMTRSRTMEERRDADIIQVL